VLYTYYDVLREFFHKKRFDEKDHHGLIGFAAIQAAPI